MTYSDTKMWVLLIAANLETLIMAYKTVLGFCIAFPTVQRNIINKFTFVRIWKYQLGSLNTEYRKDPIPFNKREDGGID